MVEDKLSLSESEARKTIDLLVKIGLARKTITASMNGLN
jgi:hypothetical protein